MQRTVLSSLTAMLAASAFTACGAGGSTGSTLTPSAPAQALPAPTAAPAISTPSTSAPATAAPTIVGAALATAKLKGALGFVNSQSHTVYVFDADLAAPGTSTCTGSCAGVWPAVTAQANLSFHAPFATIKRTDGTTQLTYAGRPLYTYVADAAPGSVAGDGLVEFGGEWHIARPQGVSAAPVASPTPAQTPVPIY